MWDDIYDGTRKSRQRWLTFSRMVDCMEMIPF